MKFPLPKLSFLNKNILPTLGVLLVLSFLLHTRFNAIFRHLGDDFVIEAWGDGLKTYTNAIFHARYDTSYNWFEGMNYPYGEHIVAATELPGIAIVIKWLSQWFPNIADHTIAIINLELVIAIFLCALFLYLIFRALHLPFWYAGIAGIAIVFLNPQYLRLFAHFGLAQPFLIPAVLYGLLQFEKGGYWLWSLFISLIVFIGSFLHFYFFAILSFLLAGYFLFRFFQEEGSFKDRLNWMKQIALPVAFMVLPSLIFFYFWMLGVDPVTDRSPDPYGFLVYVANWEGLFIWTKNPLYAWINESIIPIRKTQMEGQVYVGMVAFAFFLVLIFRFLFKKFKSPFLPKVSKHSTFMVTTFQMGFTLALFSFGLPFIIPGFEGLLDYFGPIKQFRSVGRFAWIFYFILNIWAFTVIFNWVNGFKRSTSKIFILGGILSVLVYEAYLFSYHKHVKQDRIEYHTRGKTFTEIDSIDFTKYQAVVPIPYYNVGSNNFSKGITGFVGQKSAILSIQTGLPNVGTMLTRSSRRQTFNQWQMLLETYRRPLIFDDYPNDKPLLLLWHKQLAGKLLKPYKHLLEGSRLIYEEGDLLLYEAALEDFDNRISQRTEEIEKMIASDSLFNIQSFESTDSILNFQYLSFDETSSEKAYLGKGSYGGNLNAYNELFKDTLGNVQYGNTYHVQFWVYVDDDLLASTKFHLSEEKTEGHYLQKKTFHIWPNCRTFDPNGWVLVDFEFKPVETNSFFRLTFGGDPNKEDNRTLWVDELLIKPTNTNLYKSTPTYLWKNNLHFPTNNQQPTTNN